MKDALIVSALSVLPRKRGARTMGWFARSRISRLVVRLFIKTYGIDISDAEGTLKDFPTLESLFTRSLKPGSRPIEDEIGTPVSPVDGKVAFVGTTTGGQFEIAPGKFTMISELLQQPVDGERDVVVLYLSPRDYHRVHAPQRGLATSWHYVPGTLWPVFPAAVRRIKKLFSSNERVIVHLETDEGPMDVVLVGAFGVGRITLAVCDLITNSGGKRATGELDPPILLDKGDLLGIFHLGSTVVLVTPPGSHNWTVKEGEPILVGRKLGQKIRQLPG
ncbi:MAG: phosphatidylserine decarboxylase [Proteobacteria bacterium]|nr:phosphatidylserine decarboxylase [Pseudomonadota bacterium]